MLYKLWAERTSPSYCLCSFGSLIVHVGCKTESQMNHSKAMKSSTNHTILAGFCVAKPLKEAFSERDWVLARLKKNSSHLHLLWFMITLPTLTVKRPEPQTRIICLQHIQLKRQWTENCYNENCNVAFWAVGRPNPLLPVLHPRSRCLNLCIFIYSLPIKRLTDTLT